MFRVWKWINVFELLKFDISRIFSNFKNYQEIRKIESGPHPEIFAFFTMKISQYKKNFQILKKVKISSLPITFISHFELGPDGHKPQRFAVLHIRGEVFQIRLIWRAQLRRRLHRHHIQLNVIIDLKIGKLWEQQDNEKVIFENLC